MNKDEKRYLKLNWTLLEAKYFYYHEPENKHVRSDAWYDNLEDEYKALGKKLGKKELDMIVGFPLDKPSGKLVASRCKSKDFVYTIDKR